MRHERASGPGPGQRRAWKSPQVAALTVRAETATAGTRIAQQPEPPTPPATKLGFSFEMAFPLSARVQ